MKIEDTIPISELSEKCRALLIENSILKAEIRTLKALIAEARYAGDEVTGSKSESEIIASQVKAELSSLPVQTKHMPLRYDNVSPPDMNKNTDEKEKIRLFMSLFKGRDDVYARRWENKKKGTSGYSPSCLNEWKTGVCSKPKGTCAGCSHKAYAALTEKVIDDHLRGKIVAGIYPMLPDEACWFLAIDFDDGEWQKDIAALRNVCAEFAIPVSVERSRSGNGSHAWLFFKRPIAASLARKFGTSLLTYAMQNRHEITFKSYDRFFPNQDTMPKGGLGNLIALPLQNEARKAGNSEFIDMNFEPYPDQWVFFSMIQRLSEDEVISLSLKLGQGNELGVLKIDEEEAQKPWEATKVKLLKSDYGNDILAAEREILIVSPFITKRRTLHMVQQLEIALRNKVRVTVVTRPTGDFAGKGPTTLQGTLDMLQHAGVSMVFRSNIHQKFALIDQKIVWYGSINLLSFGSAEESIMRLESPNIAGELLKSMEKQGKWTPSA